MRNLPKYIIKRENSEKRLLLKYLIPIFILAYILGVGEAARQSVVQYAW